MGDDFLFTQTRFPFKKRDETVLGKVKKVMNEFKKYKYDHTLLFHSYCDLIGVTDSGFNLWKDIKFKKGIPVISGVSVDETLLEKYVWEIRKTPADELISLLFYSGEKNRSAFETGYLVSKIMEKDSKDTYILNPSPYIVHDTVGQCRGYLVWDQYYSSAYSDQYPNDKFYEYSCTEMLDSGKRIFAQIYDEKDVSVLNTVILGSSPKEILVSISQTMFKKYRKDIMNCSMESGCNLQGILLADTVIFPASPKKHIIMFFSRNEVQWPVKVRVLCLEGEEMVIGPEEYYVNQNYFMNGIMTIRDVIRFNAPSIEKKTRNKASEYWFSKEIRIKYTNRNRRGKNIAIVCYDTIPDGAGKTNRVTPKIEKGLVYSDEKDMERRLENAVFYDELYEKIIKDVKNAYADRYEELSLKTLWFLKRYELTKWDKYDDELCEDIFIGKDHEVQNITYADIITGRKAGAIDDLIKEKNITEGQHCLYQLYILFDSWIKDKKFIYNPFRDMLGVLSNRMSEEQYEVRNALVKKVFSVNEQKKLLEGTCSNGEWCESEDINTLVVLFRLFTAIPVREMLALTWSSMDYVEEYGFYQIKVIKRVDKDGKSIVYGTKDDWKRFRIIPLVPELSRMLMTRKHRWMRKYFLSEEKMDNIPIFCDSYDRRHKEQKMMSYEKINIICRKAVKKLNIPKLEVRLPGDKELITDLNRYYSDIFLSNFRYHANHTCMMNRGQINYLMGIDQVDTYAKHYCDYTNDAVQYQMQRKLIRWISLLGTENVYFDEADPSLSNCLEYRIKAEKDEEVMIALRSNYGGTADMILRTDNDAGKENPYG